MPRSRTINSTTSVEASRDQPQQAGNRNRLQHFVRRTSNSWPKDRQSAQGTASARFQAARNRLRERSPQACGDAPVLIGEGELFSRSRFGRATDLETAGRTEAVLRSLPARLAPTTRPDASLLSLAPPMSGGRRAGDASCLSPLSFVGVVHAQLDVFASRGGQLGARADGNHAKTHLVRLHWHGVLRQHAGTATAIAKAALASV